MSLANHRGALVLTTGNKSELAVGYCTQYGDMVGALAPIGDLYKTQVYALSEWINQTFENPIPPSILTKAPSAELRPDQTDQDSLPPYEVLDPFLEAYLEKQASLSELKATFGAWVEPWLIQVDRNEYKRKQGALVLKTSEKAFGFGRRIPVLQRLTRS